MAGGGTNPKDTGQEEPGPERTGLEERGPALPGNHGQFGEDAATERFEPLKKGGETSAPQGPNQTGAGERS